MELSNPDYDEDFLVKQIANESPTFKAYLLDLIKDTDSEHKTNELWLGTLLLGENKSTTQINLSVTQDTNKFVDEF